MKAKVKAFDKMQYKHSEAAGFSFIDGMICVLLMAVVAGLTVHPFYEGLEQYRLTASAQKVASELQMARSLAQATGSVHAVSVNAAQGTVQIIDLSDPGNPIRTSKTLEKGCTFTAVPGNPIRFFPRGHARPATIEITKDERTVTIEITASGRTIVETSDEVEVEAAES